jgi:hypothetical protein
MCTGIGENSGAKTIFYEPLGSDNAVFVCIAVRSNYMPFMACTASLIRLLTQHTVTHKILIYHPETALKQKPTVNVNDVKRSELCQRIFLGRFTC